MRTQALRISDSELFDFMLRVNKLHRDGISYSEIARYFSISRTTLVVRRKRFNRILSLSSPQN